MTEVFLDTAYAIALAAPRDPYHSQAVELAIDLERRRTRLVTTRAVAVEIGNALSKIHHRPFGVGVLEFLERDPRAEIIPLSEGLYQRGFELFRQRHDKEWSLVDCMSFVVMQNRRLRDSLTTDQHFEQAGFRALLRR